MATESRTGFRLPWSLENRGVTGTVDEQVAPDSVDNASAEAAYPVLHAIEGGSATAVAGDDEQSDAPAQTAHDESLVATDETPVQADDAEPGGPANDSEATSSPEEAPVPEAPAAEAPSPSRTRAASGGDNRSNRLIAELTNAMRVAAEAARETTLSQYRAEGKAFVERVQAEASERVGDYKHQADTDIAAIRDWSKAEAARIREETERRIADRKSRLSTELDEHAARIEREIRRVENRIAGFEADMSRFFEELLKEEDPSRFGALAASLPEPPTFEAVLAEAEAAEDAEATAEVAGVEHAATMAEEPSAIVVDEAVAVSTEVVGETEVSDAAATAPEASTDEPEATAGEATTGEAEADTEAEAEAGVATDAGATADVAVADAPTTDAGPEAEADEHGEAENADAEPAANEVGSFASSYDPRLTALGLTPDYAAAEAEAEAFVDASADEGDDGSSDSGIPMIEEDALASRLNNLMPSHDQQGSWAASYTPPATRTTQVVVVGLVSVASIASFKRHLARVAGVNSVGVSSGPDGEFVFAVSHVDSVDLREVVPALPGFTARVSSAGDGIVNVTAHDPESDS